MHNISPQVSTKTYFSSSTLFSSYLPLPLSEVNNLNFAMYESVAYSIYAFGHSYKLVRAWLCICNLTIKKQTHIQSQVYVIGFQTHKQKLTLKLVR